MKTYMPKKGEVAQKWLLVDAKGKVLGRLASQIAHLLRGKHKPQYAPHVDVGDYVVVINADQVILTGKKALSKTYTHFTGYPGGLRQESFTSLLKRQPTRVIERAVRGMLPHNTLGHQQFLKMKVYAGSQHPHAAQKPEPIELN
ncbi:MAG: 50S ribosomal protein L13 [candidate division KSB1 bacterium]|nr:50S ribosomal protein L13 [candidate division KSB1 bacterium]MDZ7275024.1 50S ribosomal protein L13 [candidate division KSB1 bacterium]MDZ7286527.1 50S ribosomal protein L13 [candidate division KSB1 bacterium]MDZ7299309.1 50S ribosomal protein L13 [candidate division KSB1 bacterium]MDZ7306980.1 50S ribosomal protein L13 [candidate division KSB1 bacterium]